ncbi:MAG: OmpA family protein [Rickettsiales bacterium]
MKKYFFLFAATALTPYAPLCAQELPAVEINLDALSALAPSGEAAQKPSPHETIAPSRLTPSRLAAAASDSGYYPGPEEHDNVTPPSPPPSFNAMPPALTARAAPPPKKRKGFVTEFKEAASDLGSTVTGSVAKLFGSGKKDKKNTRNAPPPSAPNAYAQGQFDAGPYVPPAYDIARGAPPPENIRHAYAPISAEPSAPALAQNDDGSAVAYSLAPPPAPKQDNAPEKGNIYTLDNMRMSADEKWANDASTVRRAPSIIDARQKEEYVSLSSDDRQNDGASLPWEADAAVRRGAVPVPKPAIMEESDVRFSSRPAPRLPAPPPPPARRTPPSGSGIDAIASAGAPSSPPPPMPPEGRSPPLVYAQPLRAPVPLAGEKIIYAAPPGAKPGFYALRSGQMVSMEDGSVVPSAPKPREKAPPKKSPAKVAAKKTAEQKIAKTEPKKPEPPKEAPAKPAPVPPSAPAQPQSDVFDVSDLPEPPRVDAPSPPPAAPPPQKEPTKEQKTELSDVEAISKRMEELRKRRQAAVPEDLPADEDMFADLDKEATPKGSEGGGLPPRDRDAAAPPPSSAPPAQAAPASVRPAEIQEPIKEAPKEPQVAVPSAEENDVLLGMAKMDAESEEDAANRARATAAEAFAKRNVERRKSAKEPSPAAPNAPTSEEAALASLAATDAATPTSPPQQETPTTNAALTFASGEENLTAEHKKQLDAFVADVKDKGDAVSVVGYASGDAGGKSPEYISLKRVVAVRNYIVSRGVAHGRIRIKAKGDAFGNPGDADKTFVSTDKGE